jgi:hypothetical protein
MNNKKRGVFFLHFFLQKNIAEGGERTFHSLAILGN